MVLDRDILNRIQQKLESLNLFQTIRQPANVISTHDLLDMLPDLTQFPAAILLAQSTTQSDHLAFSQIDLVVIGRYFGLESERNLCETMRKTTAEAFRQTIGVEFENSGQALIMLNEISPLMLGSEYLAWNLSFEAKILNY